MDRKPFDKLRTSLAVGDRLRRSDGGIAKVLAVERVKLAEPEVVYNFTVKGPHTYFVLEVGVLVHNAGCGPIWTRERSKTLTDALASGARPAMKSPDYAAAPDESG